MIKPTLYWHIQQVKYYGGAELVSVDLMNHLIDYYNITCIVSAKLCDNPAIKINPKIKVISLNIPQEVSQIDNFINVNNKTHKYYKNIGLIFSLFLHFIIKRFIYRKKIKKIIDKNPGKLICSGADSYYFAPKKIYTIFHYHFDYSFFNQFSNRFIFRLSRKPNEIVFLTKSTMERIKSKFSKSKISYIANPCRFKAIKNLEYHNNKIIFAGRFCNQKDPMLALQIAKSLKEKKFNFFLSMYGKGNLEKDMIKYLNKYDLNNFIKIEPPTNELDKVFLNADLQLITSKFEGFVLVKYEANSCSTPTVSTYFGEPTVDMFNNGLDGTYINSRDPEILANKIIEILSDKEKLKQLKLTSYESSLSYSYENIIPKWLELLK